MPLLFTHTAPRLGVWKIEETSGELLQKLQQPELYLPCLAELSIEKRRRERLASLVLLKELAGSEYPVEYRPHGAPYLPGQSLSLSISHTRRYAAVLLSNQPAAGIDIESRSSRMQPVRDRFLAPEEQAFIHPEAENDHALICWCAKETLYKMLGQREVSLTGHLHIRPFPYASAGQIEVYETRTEARLSFTLAYRIFPDFVLVWSGEPLSGDFFHPFSVPE